MFLTVSNDKFLWNKLRRFYSSLGVFSLFTDFENMSNFVALGTDFIKFAVVDARISRKDAADAASILLMNYNGISVKILKNSHSFIDTDSHISSKDELQSFIAEIAELEHEQFTKGAFKISPALNCASLLGYPLHLTPNEHKILLTLSLDRNRIFSQDELRLTVFPFSKSTSKNQLAVHICNINKKAYQISGRKLIQNPHKNGYILNESL